MDGLRRTYVNPSDKSLNTCLKFVQRRAWSSLHRLYCARQEAEHFYFRVELFFPSECDGIFSRCFDDDNLLSWHDDLLLAGVPDQVPERIDVCAHLATSERFALVKDLIVPRANKQ